MLANFKLGSRTLAIVFRRGYASGSNRLASAIYLDPSRSTEPAVSTTPTDISAEQRNALDSALRVDQAGEVAANWIYKGQLFILGRDPSVGPLIQVCHKTLIQVIYMDL